MIATIFQSLMFCWFMISLYLVWNDETLTKEIKIIGEMVNLLCLTYILSNLIGQNNNLFFFVIGFGLLGWYLYYTPIDIMNQGYSRGTKMLYVSVDFAMIILLSISLWAASNPIAKLVISSAHQANLNIQKFLA